MKARTQASESFVVDSIPSRSVNNIKQRPMGSLLSCRGDRNFGWAGGTDIELLPGTNPNALADEVAAVFSSRSDWGVSRETSSFGEPRVALKSPRGERHYVTVDAEYWRVYVDSFSVCFHLRDDESPHGFY
jgi:hypothetical protein